VKPTLGLPISLRVIEARTLSERQALEAMRRVLKQYYDRGKSDDVLLLLHSVETGSWPDGGTNDPAAQDDWRRCVDEVLSGT
jgi:hypothetical protein